MDSDVPSWASENNLQANGLYFEGFVDDLKAVLDYRKILTVSMYGTRMGRWGKAYWSPKHSCGHPRIRKPSTHLNICDFISNCTRIYM